MKKHNTMLFVILMAVMIMFVGGLEWPEDVSAMDIYVELGYDAVDRGNSDIEKPNSLDVGAGISGDYGAIKPYAKFNAGLDESGFSVVDRALSLGTKYHVDEHTVLGIEYETQKYPGGDRVNTLGMKARYSF